MTIETLMEKGFVAVGSPDTVRQMIEEVQKELGFGTLVANFHFATMPHEQFMSSLHLFADRVMPALKHSAPGSPSLPPPAELFDVTGHSVIVTGAASGLGLAIAEVFRDAGATVTAARRRREWPRAARRDAHRAARRRRPHGAAGAGRRDGRRDRTARRRLRERRHLRGARLRVHGVRPAREPRPRELAARARHEPDERRRAHARRRRPDEGEPLRADRRHVLGRRHPGRADRRLRLLGDEGRREQPRPARGDRARAARDPRERDRARAVQHQHRRRAHAPARGRGDLRLEGAARARRRARTS